MRGAMEACSEVRCIAPIVYAARGIEANGCGEGRREAACLLQMWDCLRATMKETVRPKANSHTDWLRQAAGT